MTEPRVKPQQQRESGVVPTAQPCEPSHELARVLEAFSDPAALLRGSQYAYANPSWARLLGHDSASRLEGQDVSVDVDPRDRAALEQELEVLRRGDVSEGLGLIRMLPRLGGTLTVEVVSAQPVHLSDERVLLLVVRHAADRRKLEASLALTDRLSSVGTLAAGIAHEINNPLAYVTTNLELALEEVSELSATLPPSRTRMLQEVLAEARGGAERVRKIVRGLKTFSRFDDEERQTAIDLNAVVDLAIRLASGELKHHAVVHSRLGEVPGIVGDESRLAQVFINVLVNAAQALATRPRDQNAITITTRTNAAGDAEVRFTDNGPGIPEGLRARIFEPFFTTKPAGEGTGLGLSIAHTIVSSMGGTMSVESNAGPGVTFVITLPPTSDVTRPAATRNTGLPPVSPARARVLIIDDEPAVTRALERALSRDHDVVSSLDPREALDLIDAGADFDVILCDLMMPTMSGMEVHAELAARSAHLASRIVFVTGGAVTREARLFLESVKNARVDKPVKTKTLRTLIATLAGERERG